MRYITALQQNTQTFQTESQYIEISKDILETNNCSMDLSEESKYNDDIKIADTSFEEQDDDTTTYKLTILDASDEVIHNITKYINQHDPSTIINIKPILIQNKYINKFECKITLMPQEQDKLLAWLNEYVEDIPSTSYKSHYVIIKKKYCLNELSNQNTNRFFEYLKSINIRYIQHKHKKETIYNNTIKIHPQIYKLQQELNDITDELANLKPNSCPKSTKVTICEIKTEPQHHNAIILYLINLYQLQINIYNEDIKKIKQIKKTQ